MLDKWAISSRINSGFLLLTMLLLGFAVFAHRSVANLGNGYTEYRDIARQTVAIGAFVEDLFEARLAALHFLIDPNDSSAAAVNNNLDEIINDSTLITAFEVSPERLSEVNQLVASTRDYRDAFAEMAALMAEAKVVRVDLFDQAHQIEEDATKLFSDAAAQPGNTLANPGARLLQAVMSVVIRGKMVVISPNAAEETAFETSFSSFERTLNQIEAIARGTVLSPQIATVDEEVRRYSNLIEQYLELTAAARTIEANVLEQIGPEIQFGFDSIAEDIVGRQTTVGAEGADIVDQLTRMIPMISVVTLIFAGGAALMIGRWITRPLNALADTTGKLAAGDDTVEIKGDEHNHELGRMAQSLSLFKKAEIERKAAMAERERMQAEQNQVVEVMQKELADLANGDLTAKINQHFPSEYEDLRLNFNSAVDALHDAIARMVHTAAMIGVTTTETNNATTELSQRTENQAATLEETAAALDQLTASVKSAAEHAKSVDASVSKARAEATKNGEIVAEAVSAMGEIEKSSKQITQVISVIDDIAFQTNLLALNAGVEAARAGESGKGFAVVASEVRALAQRSAEAAKEIAALIANSSGHVQQGTRLVGEAGEALSEIITQVNDIAMMTSQIATSAEEQSIGLSEINVGVNQLDQVTQQNAAMVQESMSRGEALAHEAEKMSGLTRSFTIAGSDGHKGAGGDDFDALDAAIAGTHGQPTHRPARHHATVGGNTAAAIWEDF